MLRAGAYRRRIEKHIRAGSLAAVIVARSTPGHCRCERVPLSTRDQKLHRAGRRAFKVIASRLGVARKGRRLCSQTRGGQLQNSSASGKPGKCVSGELDRVGAAVVHDAQVLSRTVIRPDVGVKPTDAKTSGHAKGAMTNRGLFAKGPGRTAFSDAAAPVRTNT